MANTAHLKTWRLSLLVVALAAAGLGLSGRVGYLQVVEHPRFRELAQEEHWAKRTVIAPRGTIRDRNGYPLAVTVHTYAVIAERERLGDPARVAARLAPLLATTPEALLAQLTKVAKEQTSVVLRKDVPYAQGLALEKMGLPGIRLEKNIRRAYPEGNMATPLLGFVGRDQVGLTGVEADFNVELMGRHGTLLYERDSTGKAIPLGYRDLKPPEGGADLYLTIDRFVQHVIEQELDLAIAKHSANGGIIIVMNPHTGEILGMASRPTFDLTRLDLMKPRQKEMFRNPAVTDLYEPGSTFKVITMAAALNEKLVAPSTTFVDNGVVVKYGWPIYNWNGTANGRITMTEVLQKSANVGAVWVSDVLGPQRFYAYVARFGFAQPTGIGLSGEASGRVRDPGDKGWSPVDLATNSFGQGLSVTPLQMITAHAAVANGGNLMRPYVVRKMVGPQGERSFAPVMVRRVLAPETARTLAEMLHVAAEKGESRYAVVPGYRVGGKTGTAAIPTPGGYTSDETIASFIGFAPYQDPKIIVLVRIDGPKDIPWGSVVASPVFSAITRQVLQSLRVPPDPQALVSKTP